MRKSDYPKVLRRGVAGLVIVLLLFGAFAPVAMAADDWPDCSWGCTAADFDVIRVWLGDSSGDEFDPGSCTLGDQVAAYIWARIDVTAASDRYAGYVHYKLIINNVPGSLVHSCFADTVSAGPHNYNILAITWICGDKLAIGGPGPGLVISGEANSNTCPGDGKCSERTAKCYKAIDDIIVKTPLIANFEFTTVCYCTYTPFTDKTTGGGWNHTTTAGTSIMMALTR